MSSPLPQTRLIPVAVKFKDYEKLKEQFLTALRSFLSRTAATVHVITSNHSVSKHPEAHTQSLIIYIIPEGESTTIKATFNPAVVDLVAIRRLIGIVIQQYNGLSNDVYSSGITQKVLEEWNTISSSRREASVGFWRQKLRQFKGPTQLNTDIVQFNRSSDVNLVSKEANCTICFSPDFTVSTLAAASWALLLGRYDTTASEVTFGWKVDLRDDPCFSTVHPNLIIGMFTRTCPLILTPNPKDGTTLSDWISNIQDQMSSVRQHAYLDSAEIASLASAHNIQLYHTTLVVDANEDQFGGLSFPRPEGEGILVHITPSNTGCMCVRVFAQNVFIRDEFAQQFVDGLAFQMARVMDWISTNIDSNATLSPWSIPLLSDKQQSHIVSQCNRMQPQEYNKPQLLHRKFEQTAAEFPDSIAVEDGDDALSYEQLDKWSSHMASKIVDTTDKLGDKETIDGIQPVAVLIPRSLYLFVGILGVLKAGCLFIPIEENYPAERRKYVLENCRAKVIVTVSQYQEIFIGYETIFVDLAMQKEEPQDFTTLDPPGGVEAPSHILYTSGSTGKPKGVVLSHRAYSTYIEGFKKRFNYSSSDVWGFYHSIAFDLSHGEFWSGLLCGGRLIVVPWSCRQNGVQFMDVIHQHHISHLIQTPLAFRTLSEAQASTGDTEKLDSLRVIHVCGEAFDFNTCSQWFKHRPASDDACVIANCYGITETAIMSSAYVVTRDAVRNGINYNIGHNIDTGAMFVVDSKLGLTPPFMRGEVVISGLSLASGYLGLPRLTRERFVRNPFSMLGDADAGLYRTADTGWMTPNGQVVYVGRLDNLVKVRGYRVELGEIEATLESLKEVAEAVCVLQEDGTDRIIAYVRAMTGNTINNQHLRAHAAKHLPHYMVPNNIVCIDNMPRSNSGKIDRKALAARQVIDSNQELTPLQRKLRLVWEQLAQTRIGNMNDDILAELDAYHPLSIVGLASKFGKLMQRVGVEGVTPSMVLRARTLEHIATALEAGENGRNDYDCTLNGPSDKVETVVLRAFREILVRNSFGMDDDFFEAGGQSLLAVALISQIRNAFDIEIALASINNAATPRKLSSLVKDRLGGGGDRVVTLSKGFEPTSKTPRVFFVHPAFRTCLIYIPLIRSLGDKAWCFGIEDTRSTAYTSLKEMAQVYADDLCRCYPSGPLHVVGLSFGGLLGFELCRELCARGRAVASLVVLDQAAPHKERVLKDSTRLLHIMTAVAIHVPVAIGIRLNIPIERLQGMNEDEAIEFFSEHFAPYIPDSQRFVQLLFADFRNAYDICSDYHPTHKVDFPIQVIRAKQLSGFYAKLPVYVEGKDLGWKDLAYDVSVFESPGDHDTMVLPPHSSSLSSILSSILIQSKCESQK